LGASAGAQALVQQLGAFARQSATELCWVNLGPVVQKVADRLRPTLPPLVELTVQVDADVPSVLGDVTQVEQALTNLVTNSTEAFAGRAGRIEVLLERFNATPELVQAEPDFVVGPYARVSVGDNGPGVEESIRKYLFDPFFTTSEMATTAGLGLSVVHGVTTRHGGVIRVQSDSGIGTRFDLYFPGRDLPASPGVEHGDRAGRVLDSMVMAALRSHPNLMLTGETEATESMLHQLRAKLRTPVRECDCRKDLLLPHGGGTLVLRHVGALDPAQQVSLLNWLDMQNDKSQIVSLTAMPLLPSVEQGTFLDRLFYRLNTIHLPDNGGRRSYST
jgi:two-component sensor histidine kinase